MLNHAFIRWSSPAIRREPGGDHGQPGPQDPGGVRSAQPGDPADREGWRGDPQFLRRQR